MSMSLIIKLMRLVVLINSLKMRLTIAIKTVYDVYRNLVRSLACNAVQWQFHTLFEFTIVQFSLRGPA